MKPKPSARQKSRRAIFKAYDKGWWGTLVKLAQSYIELYPTDIGPQIYLARALVKLSRFAEAHETLDNALERAPQNWHEVINSERGHLEQRRGDYLQAEHWFARAIEIDPHRTYNHVFLAVLVYQSGDIARAEAIYRHAIATVAPTQGDEFDEIYANLGGVLVAQERYDEAVECFERALEN